MWNKTACFIEEYFFLQDLLIIDHHTPTPEPVKYEKKDGEWYVHDEVDVQDTLQRKGRTFNFYWVSSSGHDNYFVFLLFNEHFRTFLK